MGIEFASAVPVLPSIDIEASLQWWTQNCGFTEVFRDATPPSYAGISRGAVIIHFAKINDPRVARTVGEQTMLRIAVSGIDAFYAEYQQHGGEIHPNGGLEEKPWGGREFSVIDPAGVCVTFRA